MRHSPGYTLVEFLIYITLIVVLFVAGSSIVIALYEGRTKIQAVRVVGQNTRTALGRMVLAIENAEQILSPIPGATSTQLILSMIGASNPTIFTLQNAAVNMKEGSAATSTLTASEVEVISLLFKNVTATGTQGTIQIDLSVSSTNASNDPNYAYGQRFFTSTNVRRTQ